MEEEQRPLHSSDANGDEFKDLKPMATGIANGNGDRGRENSDDEASAGWASDAGLSPRDSTPVLQRIKHCLSCSWHERQKWYHSVEASRARTVLQGKAVGLVMVLSLLGALFLPDLWIVLGMDSNIGLDVMLSMIMALYTFEMVALMVSEQAYSFSFFHLMDLVGTLSMAFDISFLLGIDVRVPTSASVAGQANPMFTRTMRAARVGARAGRLSRVLRIFRFMPVLPGLGDRQTKGMAMVISSQLSNLLAARVTCLTILLVMVIPLFEVLSWPQTDLALQAWTERIVENLNHGDMERTMKELRQMAAFFSRHNYGPYEACRGVTADGSFVCTEYISGWEPLISAPSRGASALLVHGDNFMVAFNMQHTHMVNAGLGMASFAFIILVMVFSGMALSSVVDELAVWPLERMLLSVRQIASTVFNFNGEADGASEYSGEYSEDEEAKGDIDSASEMVLLEKVVQKLAIIADLQTREEVILTTEDMQEEDIAVLNMIQGGKTGNNIPRTNSSDKGGRATARRARKSNARLMPLIKFEDFGVSQELYESWAFNTLTLNKSQRCTLAIYTVSRFDFQGDGFVRSPDEEVTLQRFVGACESSYMPNPFHNFAHAVDVGHFVGRMLRQINSEMYLSDLEQFALLIAAIAHDLGHPGVTNAFLMETGHELALKYNDQSPLENMHCAKLYSIVSNPETNVFAKLPRQQYKEARKHCITTILHTDMMSHNNMVKELQMLYQNNSEAFTNVGMDIDSSGAIGHTTSAAEVEVFSRSESKVLIMNMVLHAADISNPCRTWEVTQVFASMVLQEFFEQGDLEKSMGIPVQFLNDREKLNRPNSQIGFIEFMIAPMFVVAIRLSPKLHGFGDNLSNNICCWEDLWVKEVKPSEEECQKVRTRVERVKTSLEDAKMRVTQ